MLAATGKLVLSRVKPQFLEDINATLIAVAVFLLILLIVLEGRNFVNRYSSFRVAKRLPGPRGVPVFGNIFQLGSVPHETFVEISKTYGDVFRIHIGSRLVVVINGYDSIRQALVKQAMDFAGRPDDLSTFKHMNTWRGYPTLAFATYNDSWKLHRKIAESSFRHFICGKQASTVEAKVREEALDLVPFLTDNNNKNGNIIDPKNIIKASVANILYSFLLSRRRPLNDEQIQRFLSMSDKFASATASGNPVDFMPWLRVFPNKTFQDFKDIIGDLNNLLAPDVKAHHDQYQEGSDRDMLDHLITVCRSTDPAELKSMGVTEEQIQGTIQDLFAAGFDTVSCVLHWFILYLMKHTDWQEKLHQELDEVVGENRLPGLADRGRLPHTEAFILEVLRHSAVIPMTIPHATTKDTTLNGYFIPQNTVVFVNLYSVSYDESRFENPKQFNPSRFLSDDGTALDPAKTDLLMPFGAGRRRCIGSELGRAELFLYCTHLMHQCQFETPEGHTLNFTPKMGLTMSPPPYQVKVSHR